MRKHNRYLLAFALAAAALVIIAAASFDESSDDSRRVIALRTIAHNLLLQSGDSTSQVLPVEKLNDKTLRVQFKTQFTYSTDSLATLVKKEADSGRLPSDYIVKVMDCKSHKVQYSFEMPLPKNEEIPCLSRIQPLNCYYIDFEFNEAGIPTILYAGAIPILLLLFGMKIPQKEHRQTVGAIGEECYEIGAYRYYPKNQMLWLGPKSTTLTSKESRVLEIFATQQNQVVPREMLQKEVWENEGVIVGRSLDVFISKLRRKLQDDARIKIISAHGKGYKLIVEPAI